MISDLALFTTAARWDLLPLTASAEAATPATNAPETSEVQECFNEGAPSEGVDAYETANHAGLSTPLFAGGVAAALALGWGVRSWFAHRENAEAKAIARDKAAERDDILVHHYALGNAIARRTSEADTFNAFSFIFLGLQGGSLDGFLYWVDNLAPKPVTEPVQNQFKAACHVVYASTPDLIADEALQNLTNRLVLTEMQTFKGAFDLHLERAWSRWLKNNPLRVNSANIRHALHQQDVNQRLRAIRFLAAGVGIGLHFKDKEEISRDLVNLVNPKNGLSQGIPLEDKARVLRILKHFGHDNLQWQEARRLIATSGSDGDRVILIETLTMDNWGLAHVESLIQATLKGIKDLKLRYVITKKLLDSQLGLVTDANALIRRIVADVMADTVRQEFSLTSKHWYSDSVEHPHIADKRLETENYFKLLCQADGASAAALLRELLQKAGVFAANADASPPTRIFADWANAGLASQDLWELLYDVLIDSVQHHTRLEWKLAAFDYLKTAVATESAATLLLAVVESAIVQGAKTPEDPENLELALKASFALSNFWQTPRTSAKKSFQALVARELKLKEERVTSWPAQTNESTREGWRKVAMYLDWATRTWQNPPKSKVDVLQIGG